MAESFPLYFLDYLITSETSVNLLNNKMSLKTCLLVNCLLQNQY